LRTYRQWNDNSKDSLEKRKKIRNGVINVRLEKGYACDQRPVERAIVTAESICGIKESSRAGRNL
jgi:hypothetical protein